MQREAPPGTGMRHVANVERGRMVTSKLPLRLDDLLRQRTVEGRPYRIQGGLES